MNPMSLGPKRSWGGRIAPSAARSAKQQNWILPLLFAVVLFAAGAWVEQISLPSHLLAYLAVTVMGLLTGVTELVARYKDKPTAPLQTFPGLIYIGVNAAVALLVLWLLKTKQIATGIVPELSPGLNQVLLAGFGSMALFRTSLFTLRVKDTDVAIGPAAVLDVILEAADRACDRLRAGPRAERVKKIMQGVDYKKAESALVQHCFQLMQNLSAVERNQLEQAVAVLDKMAMDDDIKAYNLGLLLMNYVGDDVLQEAVTALGSLITSPAAPDQPPIFAQAKQLAFSDMTAVIQFCMAIDARDCALDVAAKQAEWLEIDPALTRDADKNVVVLGRLRRFFGADTVARALAQLALNGVQAKPQQGSVDANDFIPIAPAPPAQ